MMDDGLPASIAETDIAAAAVAPARSGFTAAASVYSVIVAVQIVAPLLVTPFLTRTLSLREYGQVALALVLARVLAVVLDAGYPVAVSRGYFKSGEDDATARSLVFHCQTVVAAGAAVATVLAVLTAPLYDGALSLTLVLLGVAGAGLLGVFEIDQSLMRSRGQTKQFATSAAIYVLASQLLGLLGVLVWEEPEAFMVGWVAGTALGTAHTLLVVRPAAGRVLGAVGRRALRASLPVALPSAAYTITLMTLTYIDRFVLSYYHGPEATGRYQLAYTVGGLTIAAIGAINLAWGPEVFRALPRGPEFLRRTTTDLLVIMVVLVGVGLWLAPVGVAVLVPPDYDRAGITAAACLVMPLGALQVLQYSASHTLTWGGRLGFLVPASAGVATLQLLGNLVVVDEHPLLGPPAVTTLSFATLTGILTVLVQRRGLVRPQRRAYAVALLAVLLGVAGAALSLASASLLERAVLLLVSVGCGAVFVGPRLLRRFRTA
jgi:O-antigen/teichoic acid export membrane protein